MVFKVEYNRASNPVIVGARFYCLLHSEEIGFVDT